MSGQRRITSMPEVSVVIPTRNRRRLLLHTIASVLRQRDIAVEVVVVDDASGDGTAAAVSALRAPVRVISLDHHRGLAHARNVGFRAADAPWIALLDDDDLWAPDKLREQISGAEEVSRDWVYSSVMVLDENLRSIDLVPAPAADSLLVRLLRHNVLGGGASNVCVRSDFLRRSGGCDERLSHLADWDLWIRLARAATPAVCSAIHAAYVVRADSMIASGDGNPDAELTYLAEKHRQLSSEHETRFDRSLVRRWAAAGHLLGGRHGKAAALYLRSAASHRSARDLARSAASFRPRTGPGSSSKLPDAPEWLAAQRAAWLSVQAPG